MGYVLKRKTTVPNSELRVTIDQPGDGDGGFLQGGSFSFAPAGQEGDTHQVNDYAAKAIMGDSGLAKHFDCQPPIGGDKSAAKPATPAAAAVKKTTGPAAGTEG